MHSDTIYATDGVGVDSFDINNYDNATSIGDPNTSSWLKIVMRCSKPKEPHDLTAVPVKTVFVDFMNASKFQNFILKDHNVKEPFIWDV